MPADPAAVQFNAKNSSLIDVSNTIPETHFFLVASSPSSPMGKALIQITVLIKFDNTCTIFFDPKSFQRNYVLKQQQGQFVGDFWYDALNETRKQIVNPSSDCDLIQYELYVPETSTAGIGMPLAAANLSGFIP